MTMTLEGQVAAVLRVSSRNARFQQWESLLSNRSKRQRAGEFLVQGVRPISLAAQAGWRFRALIYDAERPLSEWARNLLRDVDALQVAMAPGLLAELGEKAEGSAPSWWPWSSCPAMTSTALTWAMASWASCWTVRPARAISAASSGQRTPSARTASSSPGMRPTSMTRGPCEPAPARCSRCPWSVAPRTAR